MRRVPEQLQRKITVASIFQLEMSRIRIWNLSVTFIGIVYLLLYPVRSSFMAEHKQARGSVGWSVASDMCRAERHPVLLSNFYLILYEITLLSYLTILMFSAQHSIWRRTKKEEKSYLNKKVLHGPSMAAGRLRKKAWVS